MSVQREIAHLENSAVKLTFTITNDDVRANYDEIVKDLAKDVQIKGFRKGKVPISIMERKFGKLLKEDALNAIISKIIREAMEDVDFPEADKPLPDCDPRIDETPELNLDTDLVFSVIYDVMPQVNVEKWEGLEVTVDDAEVTEADITAELEKLRKRNAFVIDKDDGAAAQKDDIVTVDYCELKDDGTVDSDSKREAFTFTLGSKDNPYEFDDELVGMKKGETREFTTTRSHDDSDDKDSDENSVKIDAAGRSCKLRVTLKGLKINQLPDLDDDFAQDVDEKFKTFADLRGNIEKRLKDTLKKHLRDMRFVAILQELVKENPMVIPDSMVQRDMMEQFGDLVRKTNLSEANAAKLLRTNENFFDPIKEETIKKIHSGFIIRELIKKNNLEVTEDEMVAEMKDVAEKADQPFETVKNFYEVERPDLKAYLRNTMLEDKLINLLISKNKIIKGKQVNLVDILPSNE